MLPAVVRRDVKPVMRRTLEVARTPDDEAWAKLVKRSPKRAAVFAFVRDRGEPVARDSVVAEWQVTAGVIDALILDGLLRETAERVYREAYGNEREHATPEPSLNYEQTVATVAIGEAVGLRPLLIFGSRASL